MLLAFPFSLRLARNRINHIMTDYAVFLQVADFCGSFMTPDYKKWGSFLKLKGQHDKHI